MKTLSAIFKTVLFLSTSEVGAVNKDEVAVLAMKTIIENSLISCETGCVPDSGQLCGEIWIDNWYEVMCMHPEKCDTQVDIPGSELKMRILCGASKLLPYLYTVMALSAIANSL